jgi:hypothetical protein
MSSAVPALGAALSLLVLGRVLIIRFGKRGSLNVRYAPKATELLRRREMTRRANCRHGPRRRARLIHELSWAARENNRKCYGEVALGCLVTWLPPLGS